MKNGSGHSVCNLRRLFCVIILFIFHFSSFISPLQGQNVHINGLTENAVGKRVELYCYEDMLSLGEQLLDAAVVDSAGRFGLACYVNYPRLVFVEIENYSQSFYIEPGRSYEVYLPSFRWEQDEERNIYLDPVALPLEFLNLPSDELNLRLLHFETVVDSLLSAGRVYFDFRFHPQRSRFDTLERDCRRLAGGDDGFYGRYVDYTLAAMRYSMGFATRRYMHDRFLSGAQVLYHDECFMRMLFAVYEDMVSQGTRRVPKARLMAWVQSGDLAAYLDSLGTDPLLYDEQLRELAALQALKESYYDADYDRKGVVRLVQLMAQGSKFPEHRKLAEHLLASFRQDERGAQPEPVVLPDVDGQTVALDSLHGKWVYIAFVRVGDPNSLREIETMAHFRDSVYGRYDNVRFVSICCDREFQKMYHFLRNNKRGPRYNWTWLHFDGNYRLLERYGVVSYPTFILLDPEGRLYYDITPAPGTGFLLHAPWQQAEEVEEDSWGNGLGNWQRNK